MQNEFDQISPLSEQTEQRPARYKLYDRIRDHVSLNLINAVIVGSAAAIVILLIVGILTASP